ncbi:MAG: hypothetical protein AB7V06_19890 [Candidatus Obscuribacterales bacterium]
MDLSICQTCGTIIRDRRRVCSICGAIVSKFSPTRLAVFNIGGASDHIIYKIDHLLLERVIIGARTEAMVSDSPCRRGDCIHVSRTGDDAGEKKREASDNSESSTPAVVMTATSMTFGPVLDEHVVTSQSGGSGAIVLNDVGFAGESQVALSTTGGEAVADTAGTAGMARVGTSDSLSMPSVLLDDKESIAGRSDEGSSVEVFEIEGFNDAIFDTAPSASFGSMGSDIGLSDALKHAVSGYGGDSESESERPEYDFSSLDEDYESMRVSGTREKTVVSPGASRSSPSSSAGDKDYDVSSLEDLTRGRLRKSGAAGALLSGGGGPSILSRLVGLTFATLILVAVGVGAIFFLGGTQSSSMDGAGEQPTPYTGRWNFRLVAETEGGPVEFYQFATSMKLRGNELESVGSDEGGKYAVIGNLSSEEQGRIDFRKQYDLNDGRAHPFPIEFSGVLIAPGQDESGTIARGEFRTRLSSENGTLNLGRFADVHGSWSATISQEPTSGLPLPGGNQVLYIGVGVALALVMSVIMFVRGRIAGTSRLRGGR